MMLSHILILKIFTILSNKFHIMVWFRYPSMKIPNSLSSSIDRLCTRRCKRRNQEILKEGWPMIVNLLIWVLRYNNSAEKKSNGKRKKSKRRLKNSNRSWNDSRNSLRELRNYAKTEEIPTRDVRGKVRKILTIIKAVRHNTARKKGGSSQHKSHKLSLKAAKVFTRLRSKLNIWIVHTQPIPMRFDARWRLKIDILAYCSLNV